VVLSNLVGVAVYMWGRSPTGAAVANLRQDG